MVDVEVGDPPPGSTLDVSLGRAVPAARARHGLPPVRRRPAPGQVRLPQRRPRFEASDCDWSIPIDRAGIEGAAPSAPPLARRRRPRPRSLPPLTLDSAPPRSSGFVDLRLRPSAGTVLSVKAAGRPSKSKTRPVVFFLGTPTAHRNRPADAKVIRRPVPTAPTVPSGQPPCSCPTTAKADPLDRAVRQRDRPLDVRLGRGRPARRPPHPARRPAQSASSRATDPSPCSTSSCTTARAPSPRPRGSPTPHGTCLFTGLDAGNYVAASVKPATPSRGRTSVEVVPGTTTSRDLDLQFQSRR